MAEQEAAAPCVALQERTCLDHRCPRLGCVLTTKDLGVSRLAGDSVGILHHDLEVYNSVQCLSCILTAQHFSWATFLLFVF